MTQLVTASGRLTQAGRRANVADLIRHGGYPITFIAEFCQCKVSTVLSDIAAMPTLWLLVGGMEKLPEPPPIEDR